MSAAAPPRVLVVDDETAIREALERALRLEGFVVDLAEGGTVALERLAAEPPDVVVLDVVMPDLDGIEVTKRVRGAGSRVPICILSARDEVADRVAGLRAGADDYLVKPFALEELTARLHALLRRTPSDDGVPIRVGDLTVDPARRSCAAASARSS